MIVIFVAFLALVSGGSLLMKDREFSPNENRYLAEPPRLTVDNILSGNFRMVLKIISGIRSVFAMDGSR